LTPRGVKRVKGSGGRTVKNMKIVVRIAIPHDTNRIRGSRFEHLIGTVKVIKGLTNGRGGDRRTGKGWSTASPRTRQNVGEGQFLPALTSATNQDRFSLQ